MANTRRLTVTERKLKFEEEIAQAVADAVHHKVCLTRKITRVELQILVSRRMRIPMGVQLDDSALRAEIPASAGAAS